MNDNDRRPCDYEPPVLTCFGRIADLTAGGSGPTVETGMAVGMMFVGDCSPTAQVDTTTNNNCIP